MKTIFTQLDAIFNTIRYPDLQKKVNKKKYFGKSLLLIAVVLCLSAMPKKGFSANSITLVGTVSGSFCVGSSMVISFTYVGTFTTFTAQLSDSLGAFVGSQGNPGNPDGLTVLQSVASNGTDSQSITITIPRSTVAGVAYKIRIISSATKSLPTAAFTITANKWLGTSTDWNAPANWCNGIVPDDSTNVLIQTASNYPVITGTKYVNSITINSGASLVISNGDTLSVHGALINNGTFDVTTGTLLMAGSEPQSIDGSEFVSSTIYNLIDSITDVSALTGLTIANDPLYITGQLSFGIDANAILTTNDLLVLVSNASATASIAEIQEDGDGDAESFIEGNVTVQRYFDAHRRWRLVTAPVLSLGAPTISAAWQEGGQSIAGSTSNPNPGFGTHISGPAAGTFNQSTGYDQSSSNSPSIAMLIAANSWYSIPSTLVPVTSYQGYMLFARGDRSFPVYTGTASTPATSTVLRTFGTLNTGRVLVPLADTGFTVIGNPYAATINFNQVYNNSSAALVSNSFSLWDPNIGSAANVASGTGGWVTLSWNGTSYDPSPNPHLFDGFDVNGDIQSGAAFTVNSAGIGNLQIDESDKDTGTDNHVYLFRPATGTTLSQPASPNVLLRTTLYGTDTSHAITYLADGVLNMFNPAYSDTLNWNQDIPKLFNLSQTVAILNYNQYLSIEKNPLPKAGDSIHLSIGSLIQLQPYQFVVQTTNFTNSGLNAFFVDSYTHILTPIFLGDTSINVNFTTTADPASRVPNRFTIIFKAAPGNVAYTNLSAAAQSKNINVQWKISNQLNIKNYIIERSDNGTNFIVADTIAATTDTAAYTYNWLDTNAITGINYYRVYAIGNNLSVQDTSNVVSVLLSEDASPIAAAIPLSINVYPNPVTDGSVNINLANSPAGNYRINLIDQSGNIILSETKYYGANNSPIAVSFGKDVSAGIYILQIIDPNGNKTKVTIEKQ